MSYNVNFDTIANSISNISITGIKMLDIDKIPTNAAMACPVFYPRPDGYITELSVSNDAFGSGTGKPITLSYKLNYVYAHAAIGALLDFGFYNGLISNIAAILSKLAESDAITGVTDLQIETITSVGPVNDPAGNVYHGCEIVLSIQQFGEIT